MNHRKRIGIVALNDPHIDRNECSGTLFKATEAFDLAGFETVWIKRKIPKAFKLYNKLIKLVNWLFKTTICDDRTYIGSWLYARAVDRKSIKNVDYIFVIHHFFVPLWLYKKKPIIYHSDVTFELVNNYYLSQIKGIGKRRAEALEKKALKNTSIHLSPSYWRHSSIINTYGVNPKGAYVLPYGPCINVPQIVEARILNRNRPLRIFFSGVDWERKGGDIAVNVIKRFIDKGHQCVLIIAGIKEIPKEYNHYPFIKNIGFLNKNEDSQYKKYIKEFMSSDIFFLPTKAEGAGIVFSEASAFGLPILTHDTGGVGTYVQNGINGYRIPVGSPYELYVETLEKMILPRNYSDLSKGALSLSKTFLTWDLWKEKFKEIIK